MADPADIDDEDNWCGGFYELAIDLGPPDDERLQQAITRVWAAAAVDGCFGREDSRSVRAPCTVRSLKAYGHLLGNVTVPSGARVVCGLLVTRLDDPDVDWLTFYLPMGALERSDRRLGGFPFGDDGGPGSLAWRAPLDAWLAEIAREVHRAAPIRRALIGFEVDLPDEQRTIGAVPDARWEGLLIPDGDDVRFVPANR